MECNACLQGTAKEVKPNKGTRKQGSRDNLHHVFTMHFD